MGKKHFNRKISKGIMRWLAILTAMVVLVASLDLAQFRVLAETEAETETDTIEDIFTDTGFDEPASGRDIEYIYGDPDPDPDEEFYEENPEGDGTEETEVLEDTEDTEEERLLQLETADGEEMELLGAGEPVTFENGGYPYGESMNASTIVLKVKITGTASSYQWQVGDSQTGTFADISGATSASYSFSPTNEKWYRCKVNNNSTSKAVMAKKADSTFLKPISSGNWYLSNGTMAYSVPNKTQFDIVGLYYKNGTGYWVNTSYSSGWQIGCDAQASNSGNMRCGNTGLSEIVMSFSDSNDRLVTADCQLASNCTAMGMGCDTQLGTSTVSGSYSDSCSLKAIMTGDTLKQIQMVAAASLDEALNTDVAFVFTPDAENTCSHFWIGGYSGRQVYKYNTQTPNQQYISEWSYNGTPVITEVQRLDSGMCISWANIPAGGRVKFNYSIGTVAQTGAVTKSTATAYSIMVEGADTNHYYALFKKDTGEKVKDWVTDTDNDGKIIFEELEQDTEYIVKNVTKDAYLRNPDNPEEECTPGEEETKTNIDPLNPPDEEGGGEHREPPVVTTTSTSIRVTGLDVLYQYWLENENGQRLTNILTPSGDAVEVFYENLEPGTVYYLAAKQPSNPNYDPQPIKTVCAAFFYDQKFGTQTPRQDGLEEGDHITKPANPTHEGWAFCGWYTTSNFAEGTQWDFDNNTLGLGEQYNNVKLYAKWLPHSHTWNYQIGPDNKLWAYCSTNTETDSPCMYYGASLGDCANPLSVTITTETNIETTFAPYAGTNIVDTLTEADSVNNAVGNAIYYLSDGTTLTDNTNSGSQSEGAAPVLPGDYVAKVTVRGQDGSNYTISSAFTILRKTYSVTYIDNTFNTPVASIPVGTLHEGDLISPVPSEMPHHDGYKFVGWYSSSDFAEGTLWDFDTNVMPADNLTLYAKWLMHEHEWVYEKTADNELKAYCHNPDVTPLPPCNYYADSLSECGMPVTVSITTPDTLHDFAPYDETAFVDQLSHVDSSRNTVSAIKYYLVDEENGNAETITTTANSGASSEGAAPADKGYYVAKVKITNETGAEAEIFSYFRIKPVPRTVTFVDNVHGTTTPSVENIVEKTLIPQPDAPHFDYWAFDGWYTSENYLPDELWHFDTDLMVDYDLTLYAKWLPHAHHWNYEYKNSSTLMIYCSENDVDPDPPCTWYGENLAGAANPLKVSLSTPNTEFNGTPYALSELTDTLSGADDDNNSVSEITYYVDSACMVPTTNENSGAETESGAPRNAGWYYAKVVVNGQGGTAYDVKSAFRINKATLKGINFVIDPASYPADGNEISALYKVFLGEVELVNGVDYEIVDGSVCKAADIGEYSIMVSGINNCTGSVTKTWRIVDATPPHGKIIVDGLLPTEYENYIPAESIVFDRYFNSKQKVTITAYDEDTEDSRELSVSYFLAANAYSETQIKSFPDNRWTPYPYGKSITLSDNRQYIVYAKVTDPSGNVTYLSTQGFEIDLKKPVVVGIAAGKKYCNPAMFRITEEESGIASVLIDGVEAYVPGQNDYEIEGMPGDDSPHTVSVKDKAGNETTVSKIYINSEHEHDWAPAKGGNEPTCLIDGEKLEKCRICGAQRHVPVGHGEHDMDYEDDDSWKVVWTWDAENKTYHGKAFIYCKNDCGYYEEYECTITTEIKEPEGGEEEKMIFTATVEYPDPSDPSGSTKKKEFKKTMPLSDIKEHGESELATGIIVAPGAPETTTVGLSATTAEGVLTSDEKEMLDKGGSGEGSISVTDENIQIVVFLEVSNIQGSVSPTDMVLAISDFKDEIGSKAELDQVKYIDLSMYKRVTKEKLLNGEVINKDEQTEMMPEYSTSITASVDVNDLNFPALKKGYSRTYYVSRVHDYSDEQDGREKNAQIIYKGKAVNGKLPITTSLFCTFAITYSDAYNGGGSGGGNPGGDIPGGGDPDGGNPGGDIPGGGAGGNGPGTTFDSTYISTLAYNAGGNMRGTYGFVSPSTGDKSHPVVWFVLFVIFTSLFAGMTKFLKDVGLFKVIKKIL